METLAGMRNLPCEAKTNKLPSQIPRRAGMGDFGLVCKDPRRGDVLGGGRSQLFSEEKHSDEDQNRGNVSRKWWPQHLSHAEWGF